MKRTLQLLPFICFAGISLLVVISCTESGGGDDCNSASCVPTTPQRSSEDCAYFLTSLTGTAYTHSNESTEVHRSWEYTYDPDGNRVSTVRKSDENGGGALEVEATEHRRYDENGKIIENNYQTHEPDGGFRQLLTTYTYDAVGRIEQMLTTRRKTLDDVVTETGNERTLFTYSDESVHFTSKTTALLNDDNSEYQSNTDAITYDISSTKAEITILDPNATESFPQPRTVSTYIYDANGRVIMETIRTDDENDGLFDEIKTSTFIHNDAGWMISLKREYSSGDGNSIYERTTYQYDYDWDTMTANRQYSSLGSGGELMRSQTAQLSYRQICSDNLANPYDSSQSAVGKPTYKIKNR